MKLVCILLLSASLQLSAIGHAQTVNYSAKDAAFVTVLSAIEKQTGFIFFYNNDDIRLARPVTVNLKNSPLTSALRQIFAQQPLDFDIKGKTIFITQKNQPGNQYSSSMLPVELKGKVVDSLGNPLAGATISVQNRKLSTISNADGVFSINVNEGDIVTFSFVGYERRSVTVTASLLIPGNELVISLNPLATELDELEVTVNTGYQRLRPNEVNGAVTVINNKLLNEQVGTSILDRLNGIAPALLFKTDKAGTNPNTMARLSVRGESTINGPLDPLIILDNFPYEGDIANINPNDVESVTLLKDAAATSIYGARGGNGVIVITTKRARYGQRINVSFNSNIIVNRPTNLSGANQLGSEDYILVEQWLFSRGYFNALLTAPTRRSVSPVVELLAARRSGLITAEDSARRINEFMLIDSRQQYADHFYSNGITQQYSLGLSGGNDQLAWTFSGNYDRVKTMLSSENNKINLRLNNRYRPLKNLEISTAIYFTQNKQDGPGMPGYGDVRVNNRFVPYLAFADMNGNPLPVAKDYRSAYTDTAGNGRLLDWNYYPLTDHLHDRTTTNRTEILAQLGINYQIMKGLSVNVTYQYQHQRNNAERVADMESYYMRDLVNRFTKLGVTPVTDTFRVPKGTSFTHNNSAQRSQNVRAQANFQQSFGDHAISAIGGFEVREVETLGGSFYTIYGSTENPRSTQPVDFVNRYPTYITNSGAIIPGAPRQSWGGNNNFVSTYANVSYSYLKRYTFSGSFRKDASNTFGLSTNDKWNPFWSAGLGWDLSREDFFRSKLITSLKFRTTIGFSGNVDPSRTAEAILLNGFSTITNYPTATVSSLNNPELRWEKVRQINVGFDFVFKNQVISGSLDIYQKNGSDLYGETSFNYTAWGERRVVTRNVANMRGRGVELSLTSRNLSGPVSWNTTFILNYVTNRTTAYFANGDDFSQLLSDGNMITPVIGKPLYAIAAYRWGGLSSTGDPQGYLNGALSTDYAAMVREAREKGIGGNIEYIGPSNPTLYGSLGNTVAYKKWRLSVNALFKMGYYFRKPTISYNALFAGGLGHSDFHQRWQTPGDEAFTTVPAMVYSNYPQFSARDNFYAKTSINVLKGDHIRLQFVNLSYAFPKATLYFNAANLGILWKANKENIDPDFQSGLVPGAQYSLGLRMNL